MFVSRSQGQSLSVEVTVYFACNIQYVLCKFLHNTGGYITIIKINVLFKTPYWCSYKNEHVHVYRRPQFIARLPNADESGLPRHQTWAGYASSTDVHNFYTQHCIITLLLLLWSRYEWQSMSHWVPQYFQELTDLSDTFSLLFNTYQCYWLRC